MLPEEGAEFPEVIKWYEKLCREKFGTIKFNYIITMMKDPFVHYHAFPRYDKKVNLFIRELLLMMIKFNYLKNSYQNRLKMNFGMNI